MSDFPSLLRQTLRSLSRAPGYWVAACLTLAVGLAAALGAFAPAWELLGVPFDFRAPSQIVCLSGEGAERAEFQRPLSAPDFWDLQKELKSVQGLAACRDESPLMDSQDGPEQVRTARVSPGYFQVMGLPLLFGRDFEPQESQSRGARVLILRHGFWVRHFGSDPQILGKTLNLDGRPHQIVGILAPQRRLPFFLDDAIAFQPLAFGALGDGSPRRDDPCCWVFGRLAAGASVDQLQAELDRLLPHLGPPRSAGDRSWGIKARGFLAYWRARVAPELALTTASGLLILLLACANVAHLMLARSLGRTREWGLRAALGAGHYGMRGPILMEAALLTGLSTLLAWPLIKVLQVLEVLPTELSMGRALVPLTVALVISMLVISLLPIRWASRLNLNEALREGGAASASRGSARLRGTLAILQLALAFALLVGAGLSLRALERLQGVDLGYSLKDLKVAVLRLDMRPNEDFRSRSAAFQRHIDQALRQVPGIQATAMANTRPLVDQGHEGSVWVDGRHELIQAGQHAVSPNYFKALQIPFLAGRNLEEGEATACLVSAQFARKCWGEASPLGRQVREGSATGTPLTVVGMVGDARMSRMSREAAPAIYTSLACWGSSYVTVYLRSTAPAAALRRAVQEASRHADGGARLLKFQSLEALATRELEEPRALRRQTLGAGILAAFLAGIGLMGTLAQAAARQKREWGIRMALGASPRSLFGLVARRVLALLAAGLSLGAGFAWILGRLLQHQFQGISPTDPGLMGFALVSLGLTCLLAGLGPALRAARINPAETLRSE